MEELVITAVGPDRPGLVGRLTALQNVLTGRLGYVSLWRSMALFYTRHDRGLALDALERVGMLHKAVQRSDLLSGGEKQRVAIARALAQQPSVLLADEPVANLDPELASGVLEDLRRISKESGVATLLNVHNIVQARQYADRIIGIAQGRVVFDGAPGDFGEEALRNVYRFDREDSRAALAGVLEPLVLLDLDRALQEGEHRADTHERALEERL